MCFPVRKKGHLVPDSQQVSAAAYRLPSDSFTRNVQFCVGFKGNLTYIQTRKWIKRCHFPLSLISPPLVLSQKHKKRKSKRGALSCLVFSHNSPGWTPCCGDNLHFDWCTLEVSTWRFKKQMHWKAVQGSSEETHFSDYSAVWAVEQQIIAWDSSCFINRSAGTQIWC